MGRAGYTKFRTLPLYMLRNQMMHGGTTWNSSVNRDQVKDGAAILGVLLPVMIDLMLDHPHEDWGTPCYPVVGTPTENAIKRISGREMTHR